MSKILVIGAAGLIGGEVVKALGERECIRASRNSGERVDISDPKSLVALFDRVGGIVCTGGAARYKPWDQLTDEDWTFSLANKLLPLSCSPTNLGSTPLSAHLPLAALCLAQDAKGLCCADRERPLCLR